MQNATVHDLKQALKRHVDLRQVRENGIKFISWYGHLLSLSTENCRAMRERFSRALGRNFFFGAVRILFTRIRYRPHMFVSVTFFFKVLCVEEKLAGI